MELLDYTEKSFVVIGDTKNVKDKLKELGGRYNPNLTHPETKEKLSAWIFSKKQKEKIQTFIRDPGSSIDTSKSVAPSDPIDSIVDPIHRLGLRENGCDPPKKKRATTTKFSSSGYFQERSESSRAFRLLPGHSTEHSLRLGESSVDHPVVGKVNVTLENEVPEVPEFQEMPSFTMIVPKVGMKVKLKNEDNEELILRIKETKKNKDGYILEFNAVDVGDESIVIDFVMVGKEWRRMLTDVPHWMKFI